MRPDRIPHRGSPRLRWACSAAVAGVLTLTSCGLPQDGTVRTVDDSSVPYRLLESDAPSAGSSVGPSEIGHVPVVLWLTGRGPDPVPRHDAHAAELELAEELKRQAEARQ